MFLCNTCGMLLDNDAAFCPVCGQTFTTLRLLPKSLEKQANVHSDEKVLKK